MSFYAKIDPGSYPPNEVFQDAHMMGTNAGPGTVVMVCGPPIATEGDGYDD
jgi:hypothetical protein